MSQEAMKDPRYRMIQAELRGLNSRMDAFLETQKPKPFSINTRVISKATAFSDTEVSCAGFDLIQISTDGRLDDVTYKVEQVDGNISPSMKASEAPRIPGPITALFLSNAVVEYERSVTVSRFIASPVVLAALLHTPPSAVAMPAAFYAEKVEYAAAALNYFESDEPMGGTPTLYMDGIPEGAYFIRIDTIKFQMNPTNAVTYQLYLLEDAQADDEQQESNIIFDSGAGMVAGTVYVQVSGGSPAKLPITAYLAYTGRIYYMIDWSAAPGDTGGYIKVYGEVLAGSGRIGTGSVGGGDESGGGGVAQTTAIGERV